MEDGIEMLFEAMSAEDQQAIIDDPGTPITRELADELIAKFNEEVDGGKDGA